MVEKKAAREGKTREVWMEEGDGLGDSRDGPGHAGTPSLGTRLPPAACQPTLFSLRRTEENNKRIVSQDWNEPQGDKAELCKSVT